MSESMGVRLILEPTVELVASTMTDEAAIDRWLAGHDTEWRAGRNGNAAESVAEAAGRNCYWSYERGRDSAAYFDHILDSRHFSVLEHASFSFAISGVSRSLTHELVRHRHMSPSQLSQRYCDQVDPRLGLGIVVPPAMLPWEKAWRRAARTNGDHFVDRPLTQPADHGEDDIENSEMFADWCRDCQSSLRRYRVTRDRLVAAGHDRKTAHDAARYVLPEACETRLFLSGNARSWLEAIPKRTDPAAALEIGRLVHVFASKLKAAAPLIFRDFELGS